MWPYDMSYSELRDFVFDHDRELLEILLEAYDQTVRAVIAEHMQDALEAYMDGGY